MTRRIHRLAAEDLAGAIRFYRAEAGAGVARRFLLEFERVVSLLEHHPHLGTPTAEGRRSHPLTDFPYSVIYTAVSDEILVLVLRHHSRDPEFGVARR